MNSFQKGRIGENQAAEYVQNLGMKIVKQNYHSPWGEIDIIALSEEVLVFIEVKTWTTFDKENLQWAITKQKKDRIIKTAKFFIMNHREYSHMAMRFDIIFIKEKGVDHIVSAFMECV